MHTWAPSLILNKQIENSLFKIWKWLILKDAVQIRTTAKIKVSSYNEIRMHESENKRNT
jgi:hypothetical protein